MSVNKYSSIFLKLVLQLLLIIICVNAFSQKIFRRHFIIAYDVSTPFIKSEKTCAVYEQALVNLFMNKNVEGANEKYENNLMIEKKNQVPFFDKEKDEISFFHFNVAKSEMDQLKRGSNADKKATLSAFNKTFIKDKNINWTSFLKKGKNDVAEYINSLFNCPVTPPDFGGGVSMSFSVFPLILNNIDTTQYSKEYILILASDFLAGSTFGNSKDLLRLKDIYGHNTGNLPVNYVKEEINYLSSQFYKIDFFNYSFCPVPNHRGDTNSIAFISYKIKPKIGILTPEDVALFVDGDLRLNQQGFQSTNFKTNDTKIKFTHNKNLVSVELSLTISMPLDNGEKILFRDVIAVKDKAGEWVSEYTNNSDLMKFDSSELTYDIPQLKIKLDSVVNTRDFENLNFKYTFKTKYEIANTQPVNFVYFTDRALPIANINYSTKTTIIIMTIVIPLLAVIGLLIFLTFYGKPRRLYIQIGEYLDSFEKVDFENEGKMSTPYKAWNYELQKGVDLQLLKGSVGYKSATYPFNWKSRVYLMLTVEKIPSGFEMFLKPDIGGLKEFASGSAMEISQIKNHELKFAVGIRQTDITKIIGDPELVKFRIEAVIKDSVLFMNAQINNTVTYRFHIGEDLKDVWISFDPGTTGSCLACGSSAENILLSIESQSGNEITPSVIAFDKRENFNQNMSGISRHLYSYGTKANSGKSNKVNNKSFQSIKKLLGYTWQEKIKFNNGQEFEISGKQLAGLLIKCLYEDSEIFFNKAVGNDYKRENRFDPLRAVVAIPNNFTASKIQDMVDCISSLNQFKEIRYIYEAEAVLFYYLSNSSKFNDENSSSDSEVILIFDMGGATINASIVATNKKLVTNRVKYDINLLGKIGYGIGGDTIDYCIIKFLLSFSNEYREFKKFDINIDKEILTEMAFEIKLTIIENFYTGKEYLITPVRLETIVMQRLRINIKIEDDSELNSYFLKTDGRFKFFEHEIFMNTIYYNVKDAVNEIKGLAGKIKIDKVIFSGRSTSFPLIKETVQKQLDVTKNSIRCIPLDLEESKVAVAKGACWYGINKDLVRLNNLKTKASFGFKKTQSADVTDVKFYELIEMGCSFDKNVDGIDSIDEYQNIEDDFASDGRKVNFYQVMGKNATQILSEGQKHKFSKVATIILDKVSAKVGMKVSENDEIECAVKLETDQLLTAKGRVADQEIDEANEEHYTWNVK